MMNQGMKVAPIQKTKKRPLSGTFSPINQSNIPLTHLTLVSKLKRSATAISTTPFSISFSAKSSVMPRVISSGFVPSETRSATWRMYVPDESRRRECARVASCEESGCEG